ncbi:MAG: HigA family addiction module antidote protein [Bacteroidales bacterium]|nr:HigA family addiction module antidote protein [Bacteroidales bacterium]
METKNSIMLYRAVHPGEILREELKARGIKQKDFAKSIGMIPSNFNTIINGKRNITEKIAERIAEQLQGITVSFWVRVQKNYNETVKQTVKNEVKPQQQEENVDIAILKHFAIIENEILQLRRLLIRK